MSAKAQDVAARVLSDLRGRSGFDHLLDDYQDYIPEIINDIADRIAEAYEDMERNQWRM